MAKDDHDRAVALRRIHRGHRRQLEQRRQRHHPGLRVLDGSRRPDQWAALSQAVREHQRDAELRRADPGLRSPGRRRLRRPRHLPRVNPGRTPAPVTTTPAPVHDPGAGTTTPAPVTTAGYDAGSAPVTTPAPPVTQPTPVGAPVHHRHPLKRIAWVPLRSARKNGAQHETDRDRDCLGQLASSAVNSAGRSLAGRPSSRPPARPCSELRLSLALTGAPTAAPLGPTVRFS